MLDSLLRRGYFPAELPPTFSTELFADAMDGHPPGFTNRRFKSKMLSHNMARAGTLRRQLGIPNPVTHFQLCECLSSGWPAVQTYIKRSTIAQSNPVPCPLRERAFTMATPHDELKMLKAIHRSSCKYILVADISRFYHSIYTHSIPWVFYSKTTAKSLRGKHYSSLFGNRLDELIRNSQDGQTIGIPVGPDTSFIIAELLLSAVDVQLKAFHGCSWGLRHVDDFEFGFHTASEAESGIAALQEILSVYELELNPTKTAIHSFPTALEAEWAHAIRHIDLRPAPRAQKHDIIWLFDTAFSFLPSNPDKHIVKFALGNVMHSLIDPTNWELLEDLTTQCIVIEPGAIAEALSILIRLQLSGHILRSDRLEETLNRTIERHAPLGHGSEAAWSLWGCLALNLSLSKKACDAVVAANDSVVALLALDAYNQGLAPSLNISNWAAKMNTKELFEEHWLLAYEANVQGWLASGGRRDHVSADPQFGFLKAAGVKFYNPVVRPVVPPRPRRTPTIIMSGS